MIDFIPIALIVRVLFGIVELQITIDTPRDQLEGKFLLWTSN